MKPTESKELLLVCHKLGASIGKPASPLSMHSLQIAPEKKAEALISLVRAAEAVTGKELAPEDWKPSAAAVFAFVHGFCNDDAKTSLRRIVGSVDGATKSLDDLLHVLAAADALGVIDAAPNSHGYVVEVLNMLAELRTALTDTIR